jgi:hypothetical protein
MIHTNRYRFGSVFTLVFAGVFILGLVVSSVVPALAGPLASRKTSRLAYHDEWRKLWEDHITWTRIVILGVLDELPGTGAYVDRLLQNSQDMQGSLEPYYGDDAGVLGDLIQDHLVIAAEILTAAHSGDTGRLNDAVERWYANAEDIAAQMNRMNPKFWPFEQTRQMWFDHLDATLEEATANLSGDFTAEVAAYDRVHDLALEMADFFSDGVIRQFPQRFTGP